MMERAPTILEGPVDCNQIPNESMGLIIYNQLKKWDKNRIIMVDHTGEEISCGTFLDLSVNISNNLKKMGVKKGDVVTILSHNHYKYLLTIVAGFYLGAQVNLLNPDYTSGELKYFFEICHPVVIFCTTQTLPNVLKLENEEVFPPFVIIYDGDETTKVKTFDEFLINANTDSDTTPLDLDIKKDVALILTSSGTTGFPKCLQLTHFNIRVNILYGLDPNILNINSDDVVLEFLPFFHIWGCGTTLTSVILGAKTIIMRKFVPDRFLNNIQQYKTTKVFVVPPILMFLARNPLVAQYDLSSLKDIGCGGAPAAKKLIETVRDRFDVIVRQIYGMSESGGPVTVVPPKIQKCGSVGICTTTFKLRICDPETGRGLPAYQVGELRMKGDGVMTGYLGDQKKTEEAFDQEGYLRSGDLGFYDDDGYFYIIDRLKEIIKYKGFQVAPAEIESLLVQLPAVEDAAVVGKTDERSGELAVAFVVKQQNCKVTEEELVNYIAEKLSVQKHLHGGVRFIDEIPKSSTGKILRRKLRELL